MGSVAMPSVLDLTEFAVSQDQLDALAPHCSSVATSETSSRNPSLKDLADELKTSPRPELNYELFGVVEHRGDEMQGGHYVAYVNSGISLAREQWFGISDAKMWKCDRAEAMKSEAYIAFYRRATNSNGEACTAGASEESREVQPVVTHDDGLAETDNP